MLYSTLLVYYEFIGEKQGISLHESQEQIQRGSGAKGPRPKNWKCRPAPLPLGQIPAIAPAPAESAPEIGEIISLKRKVKTSSYLMMSFLTLNCKWPVNSLCFIGN